MDIPDSGSAFWLRWVSTETGQFHNLVERFFGLLSGHALQRGSHTSIPQLRQAIGDYIEAHNETGKPFKWTKTADEILEKMRRFGIRTQEAHGA